eukprot:6498709-Pyramimonas_sp.AAC.1
MDLSTHSDVLVTAHLLFGHVLHGVPVREDVLVTLVTAHLLFGHVLHGVPVREDFDQQEAPLPRLEPPLRPPPALAPALRQPGQNLPGPPADVDLQRNLRPTGRLRNGTSICYTTHFVIGMGLRGVVCTLAVTGT